MFIYFYCLMLLGIILTTEVLVMTVPQPYPPLPAAFNYVCTEVDDICLPLNAVCIHSQQLEANNLSNSSVPGTSFRCSCDKYFYFDLESLQCLPGRQKVCKDNSDCQDASLVCDAALKRCGCDVSSNYLPLSKDRCEKRMCLEDEDCSGGGQLEFGCDLAVGYCRCASGYFADVTTCSEIRGASCSAIGALYSVCWYHGQQSNYYCDPLRRTCQCRPGFYSKLGRCTQGYRSSCLSGRQCSRERNMGENSICHAGKCSCAMGFLYNQRSNQCQSGLHLDCSDDATRCARFGQAYACVDGICECSANYHIQGDSCQPVSSKGVGCYNDENCHRVFGTHAACLFFSTCSCNSGYYMVRAEREMCQLIEDRYRVLCPYVIEGMDIGLTWCRKIDNCWVVTVNGTTSKGCINVAESLVNEGNLTCNADYYSGTRNCFLHDTLGETCIRCQVAVSFNEAPHCSCAHCFAIMTICLLSSSFIKYCMI